TLSMFAVSADANTSAGAPWLTWVASVEDAAKLKVTFAPGFEVSNTVPNSLNASVKDAAASTMTSPVTFGVGVVVEAPVVEVGADGDEESPHAADTRANTATRSMERRSVRFIDAEIRQ